MPRSEAAKENARIRAAEYRAKFPEKSRAAVRKAMAAKPTYHAARIAQWAAKNPERIKRIRAASKARRRARPGMRLIESMCQRVRILLKGGKAGRRTLDLLGYTAEQLRRHVESQFLPGMTWENHGRVWHLDHIIPVTAFHVSGPDDPNLKACHALSNLRPLWAADNIRKGARLPDDSPPRGEWVSIQAVA